MISYIKPIKKIALSEIIKTIGATVVGVIEESRLICGIADIQKADSNYIAFISSYSYMSFLETTNAYAVIVNKKIATQKKEKSIKTPFLVVEDPYIAFATAMQMFYKEKEYSAYIAKNATIHKSAIIGEDCYISEGVFIGENVKIGNNVYIGPNSVISNDASIGNNTVINSLVSIKYTSIGNNCIIHDGCRIGQDGFGFAPDYNKRHVKIPQVGSVVIEDFVEIGANTCIDRGAINNTIIKSGTKIDNLVQIGHNVVVGENCFLGGQVGISGSTVLENKVAVAGQSGLAPHITIKEGARISPKSGVFRDIPKNTAVVGSPSRNFFEGMRLEAIFNKLLNDSKKQK